MNLLLTSTLPEGQAVFLKSSLVILYLILAALVLSCMAFTFIMLRSPMDGATPKILMVFLFLVTAFVLISAIVCTDQYNKLTTAPTPGSSLADRPTTEAPEETSENTTPPIIPGSPLAAYHTTNTDPDNWGIKWDIMQNSNVLNSYTYPDPINFGEVNEYTALEGVTNFRGNHYRNSASYGFANIVSGTISVNWSSDIGSLNEMSGCGWTGQPLIVRWSDADKAPMNLKTEKKSKANLVEVIYPTMDGNIYFYDLEDGSYTRDPIFIGMNFMCSGMLDPRGYPLLYLGASDGENKSPRFYVISLIDGSILYEQTGSDIDAYIRQFAFEAAPLLCAESDTLIWPCASGIIYVIKLNSAYNKDAGTVSVKPENMVKLRYKTETNGSVGSVSSPIAADGYLYYTDSAGMVFCIDLNTMKLVWAQSAGDRICATPVFQKNENGEAFLYTATAAENNRNRCILYKLDAHTGEIIWEYTADNIKPHTSNIGGVLSSPLLGQTGTTLEGMIVFNIANGMLLAMDTSTGTPVWEQELSAYSLSSPIALYNAEGVGYITVCDSLGTVALYEAATGNLLNSLNVGICIDSSPAAFENTIVVGTAGTKVYSFTVE